MVFLNSLVFSMPVRVALEDWNSWWLSGEVERNSVGMLRDSLASVKDLIGIPKVKVIVGVRRCGKSTLLYQIIDYLIRENLAEPNEIVLMNFDDARFRAVSVDKIYETYIEMQRPKKIFLFLDEVHKAKDWVSLVRRLSDQRKADIFVTDSSSYYIPRDYARVLTGRKLEMELYPFSFSEYLKFYNVDIRPYGMENRSALRGYLRDFMRYGGFPEVHVYRHIWKKILIGYFDDIITQDVVSRFSVDYRKVNDLAYYLISNIGQRITLRKLRNILGLGLDTIEKYLDHLESVYMIFTVRRYSTKVKEQIVSPRKIYAIDTGLANVIGYTSSENLGPTLENLVFIELKRRGYDLFYYQSNDKEIDFIVLENRRIVELINVAYTLENEKTRRREINSLISGMRKLNTSRATIITWDESETIEIGTKRIRVIPAYEWLTSRKLK